MPFSKCLRAKIYSNMNIYFDPQGCQTLLLKESDPLLFSLGSWTIRLKFSSLLKICGYKSTEGVLILPFLGSFFSFSLTDEA